MPEYSIDGYWELIVKLKERLKGLWMEFGRNNEDFS
jgi:hypothetical protein